MRDTTLYQHLLGLEHPWTVEKVDLDVEHQRGFRGTLLSRVRGTLLSSCE